MDHFERVHVIPIHAVMTDVFFDCKQINIILNIELGFVAFGQKICVRTVESLSNKSNLLTDLVYQNGSFFVSK
jgi:hypothetical protein